MKSLFFKLYLLIIVLVMSSDILFAQVNWKKYPGNPLNIHGSLGSWNQSVLTPWVIFNPDSNRYEMWFTAFSNYPNAGIGFAYSIDGINWTLHPTPVMTPGVTGWDSLFVGAACVLKEGGIYKMWYTGWKSSTRLPHSIGYATSPDGIKWTKHPENPVLSPLTGWESGAVGYQSVIKVSGGYLMFYTGEAVNALTGRAFSSDGISWQRYVNNPVLLAGGVGEWDRNNYLARVIEMNDSLYLWYTGESNPGVSGTAIGFAISADTGKTWTKYSGNPVLTRGTTVSWDHGWIETGGILSAQKELKLYYDGGSTSEGRIGLATTPFIPVSVDDEITQPTEFSLEQNFPNPFNPSTTISWQSPVHSQQTIKVFDVLGNEVSTLVDEFKPAGSFEVEFDASALASGVYFYQLKAEEYIATKKMILLK